MVIALIRLRIASAQDNQYSLSKKRLVILSAITVAFALTDAAFFITIPLSIKSLTITMGYLFIVMNWLGLMTILINFIEMA